ncbi:MAG: cupin domain-containing protein [Proteobacteria bacterium]|nr:cupin domain-containing protein [Pseudomonadota bacterium]
MGTEPEILIFVDLRDKKLFKSCLKVLGKARELADALSGRTAALLFSASNQKDSHGCLPPEMSAENCIAHGADTVYVLDHPSFAVPRADIYSIALVSLLEKKRPMLALFALSDFGRELASRVSGLASLGLIADCVDLRIADNNVIATCPAWGGEIMAEICFTDSERCGLATVRASEFQAGTIVGNPGSTEYVEVDGSNLSSPVTLISTGLEPGDHRKLEDADIVVAGGAGLGSADGFGLIRQLAAALGGEVGATRPPVLQHWVEEERLIGQTGKSVNPKLLFSIGTSGAIQYTTGITESGTIVAVNVAPHATIFKVADIGIVADARALLPVLIEKVQRMVMRKLADTLAEDDKIQTDGPRRVRSKKQSSFGSRMKTLRDTHGLSPETMAQSTGKTPDFIEQVESDKITPSVSFLLSLAKVFKVDPSTFLTQGEKTAIMDKRAEQFSKRTQNYSYDTLTLESDSEHLRVFMVNIEPRQTHKSVAYKHEGEEFIYVMNGELELVVGSKVFNLKIGEYKHFNSDVLHKLKSLSDEPTQCLVALYTP